MGAFIYYVRKFSENLMIFVSWKTLRKYQMNGSIQNCRSSSVIRNTAQRTMAKRMD